MSQHITKHHLNFLNEAREAFESDIKLHTYRDENDSFIALRIGMDRDCVLIYGLGECIGNFVQQLKSPKVGYRNES